MAWSALSPLAATRHLLLLECLIKHLEKGLDMASNLLLCLRLSRRFHWRPIVALRNERKS